MFRDTSTTDKYPKTLLIRNTVGGMIWQVYHVQNDKEAELLSTNAHKNAFLDRELTDYLDEEETFTDWRETEGGLNIITKAKEQ